MEISRIIPARNWNIKLVDIVPAVATVPCKILVQVPDCKLNGRNLIFNFTAFRTIVEFAACPTCHKGRESDFVFFDQLKNIPADKLTVANRPPDHCRLPEPSRG